MQSFDHNAHWPKIGVCAPLEEVELGPHLTQCRLAEAYLPTKWHDPASRLATKDMGRKLGGGCAPLGEEEELVPI